MFFIYAHIYLAAARQALGDKAPAVKSLRTALDAALPDNLLMPFVESNSHIQPLLRSLQRDRRREGVRRILDLAGNWNMGLRGMDAALAPYCLTPRQLELIRLAAVGKTFKEIAMHTGLAHGTVKNNFAALYKRFGVHGVKELVDNVMRAGLPVTPRQDVPL
ncbi:MAG: helix-turn-helix transcriptional regulator [Desulfovibrio sp.]|jgi:LuxR family maltose regulon positive regulatory protein|nr:helix-turn-helix transcriptional regulator [Desulfovibrio sp.]